MAKPAMVAEGFRDRLIRAMDTGCVSKKELAESLGLQAQTVRKWELGGCVPTDESVHGVARVTGVPYRWLLTGVVSEYASPAGSVLRPDLIVKGSNGLLYAVDVKVLQKVGSVADAVSAESDFFLEFFAEALSDGRARLGLGVPSPKEPSPKVISRSLWDKQPQPAGFEPSDISGRT